MNTIDNTANVIDSRDLISRIETLEEALEEPQKDIVRIQEELAGLLKVAEQAKGYGDWERGEVLIREPYFVQYITELIKEYYELPKYLHSDHWPFCHMKMDYEAAAEEARIDYAEVDFMGETYFIHV